MAKKGGDTTVKRQLAPSFWKIRRKHGQFVVRTRPGPHPKAISYPLGVLLRDVLKVGQRMDEVKKMLNDGKVVCRWSGEEKRWLAGRINGHYRTDSFISILSFGTER